MRGGDVYGYLGPNGAGKTTSLRMLLGLIRPDAGTARLFGRDPVLEGARALDGVAGFVEAPRFYPYLNGRRNLELVAALDGGDAAERIDDALDTVDLYGRAKDKVRGYSHGMKQRLGIAGALLRDPKLLLLDEPTTGLDPAGMRDMRALIHRLAEDGLTVLLSSHLMDEVEDLCDRVAIVTRGRVVYEGSLDELIASTSGRYDLRTTDDGPAAVIAGALAGHRRRADVRAGALVLRRRARGGGADARARAGRDRPAGARPAHRHARGAVLPDDRGRAANRTRARAGDGMSALAVPLRRRPGVRVVYVWELRKLAAQKRTYIGLGCAVLVPLIFVASLLAGDGGPDGVPYGDYVRESGLAIPLVGLYFGAFWFFPLITALVAGDIVASEDGNGTLKTILTRSVDRWQIFAGKVLAAFTYAFAALVLFVGVGVAVGGLFWGFDPLVTLSGTDDLGRPLAAAARRGHARLLPPDARDRLARVAALDGHPQLGRGGGRGP